MFFPLVFKGFLIGKSQVHHLLTLRPAPGPLPALCHVLAQLLRCRRRRPGAHAPLRGVGDAQQIAVEATEDGDGADWATPEMETSRGMGSHQPYR